MSKPPGNTVYAVHAFRWGSNENHSYILGIYTKKAAALKAAEAELEYRGGKYSCRVEEWVLGHLRHDGEPKIILREEAHPAFPLPGAARAQGEE